MAIKKAKTKKGKKVVIKRVKPKTKAPVSTKKEVKEYANNVIWSFSQKGKTKRLFGATTVTHRSMQTLIEQTTRSFWMFVWSLFLLVGTLIWSFRVDDTKPDSILFTGGLDMRETISGDTTDLGETLDTQVVIENETYRDMIQKNINNLYANVNQKNVVGIANYFDSYMQKSDIVTKYFTPQRLELLSQYIPGWIEVTSIDELPLLRSERVRASYSLRYSLRDGQVFEETWEVTMRPQDGDRKIGTIGCVSKGCSVHPFFNFEKYDIK